jgi:hypothetical protein
MDHVSQIRRSGRVISRLLGFIAGLALFLMLLAALLVWSAGRFAPSLLDSALFSRSGSSLSAESNDSNLFAGRIALGGVRVTAASRWQERELIKAREARVVVDPFSFYGAGPRVIRELHLEVDELVIAGREDYLADNSLRDLILSYSSESPASAPPDAAATARFRIERLVIHVGRIRVIAGDGTARRRTVVDRAADLRLEAHDVDETSLGEKVWLPLTSQLTSLAARIGVDAVVDEAKEKLIRAAESLLSR